MDISTTPTSGIKRRGFGSLSPERRKEIAALGGRSVPEEKRSFAQNRDLAREAGRKGGTQSSRVKREAADVG
jgi:general stress protein YciG